MKCNKQEAEHKIRTLTKNHPVLNDITDKSKGTVILGYECGITQVNTGEAKDTE
jgi:hypothetical protein